MSAARNARGSIRSTGATGLTAVPAAVEILVEGETVTGRAGQTIAGVLLGSGRVAWRGAQHGERGVFCGIGVCHDCLVTVNDVEGVRACQREAVDGDRVEREVRE
ncbi:(2Fe-2S)-binding protein [Agromyces italicus]|uniref:(2Fe-2S)-binding protein n=1 Tax=Agromyces italicus TaxID=279572 RepID=UPI0003B325B0|nr:(2Fe-2S)-binding protein [Agromyces italicus]